MNHRSRLIRQLQAHRPRDARESRSLSRTLALLQWLPDPLAEAADPTHVTSSAVVVDDAGRVVLHRHKRLGIWLQPGGHVDPGESCEQAAVREVAEETGLVAEHDLTAGEATPLHVDVHQGPRGHVHLDVRWLLRADASTPLRPAAGESPDVAWFDPVDAVERTDEAAGGAVRAAAVRLGLPAPRSRR